MRNSYLFLLLGTPSVSLAGTGGASDITFLYLILGLLLVLLISLPFIMKGMNWAFAKAVELFHAIWKREEEEPSQEWDEMVQLGI